MGHQINFIFSRNDRKEFSRFVLSRPDCQFIGQTTHNNEIKKYELGVTHKVNDGVCIALVGSSSNVHLVKEADGNTGFVDLDRSDVVEYSFYDDSENEYIASRLYYVSKYYDENERRTEKSIAFTKMAKELFGWIRKYSVMVESSYRLYVSKELSTRMNDYSIDWSYGTPRLVRKGFAPND